MVGPASSLNTYVHRLPFFGQGSDLIRELIADQQTILFDIYGDRGARPANSYLLGNISCSVSPQSIAYL